MDLIKRMALNKHSVYYLILVWWVAEFMITGDPLPVIHAILLTILHFVIWPVAVEKFTEALDD